MVSDKRKIIITGATSGLGAELTRRFIKAGWKVGAAGRNVQALDNLRLSSHNEIETAIIDVCSNDAGPRLMELIKRVGGMDIYLHCPGILIDNPELDPEKEVMTVATNAGGLCRMLAVTFNYFRKEQRPGRIAAISSVAGCRGLGDMPAYSASKAFCQAFMEALRQRAHKLKMPLSIVDIRPGWTRTPLLDNSRKYMLEMDASVVADHIFKAVIAGRRIATIGLRWKILTTIERVIPGAIWERLHLPLWK